MTTPLNEGFEGYSVGEVPPYGIYAPLGGTSVGVVSDARAHAGTKSLTGNPYDEENPFAQAVPIMGDDISAPCVTSAWVYLTRRTDPDAASLGTPDVALVLPGEGDAIAAVMVIGFADGADIFGLPINSVYTIDSSDPLYVITGADEIPVDGWYQYRLELVAVSSTVARIIATVTNEAGDLFLDRTADIPTTFADPANWMMILNATVESWFDEVMIGVVLPEGSGQSGAPRRRFT